MRQIAMGAASEQLRKPGVDADERHARSTTLMVNRILEKPTLLEAFTQLVNERREMTGHKEIHISLISVDAWLNKAAELVQQSEERPPALK